MKRILRSFTVVFVAGSFLLASGCGKKDDATAVATVQVIDASKLRPSFAAASDENKAMVETVMTSIQSSDYRTALANLEKLTQAQGVTDAQKQVVNDVKDQVEKKQASIAAASGQ